MHKHIYIERRERLVRQKEGDKAEEFSKKEGLEELFLHLFDLSGYA